MTTSTWHSRVNLNSPNKIILKPTPIKCHIQPIINNRCQLKPKSQSQKQSSIANQYHPCRVVCIKPSCKHYRLRHAWVCDWLLLARKSKCHFIGLGARWLYLSLAVARRQSYLLSDRFQWFCIAMRPIKLYWFFRDCGLWKDCQIVVNVSM